MEIHALRHQINVLRKAQRGGARLNRVDRSLWVCLCRGGRTGEQPWLSSNLSFSPRKQSGKQHKSQLGSRLRPTRFDPALKVQSQLLAEEEVLSGQSTPRPQADPDEPQGIQQKIEHSQQHVGQEIEFRHQRQGRIPRTLSSLKGGDRGVQNYCGRQREIRMPRVIWRELETGLRRFLGAAAPVPDPTRRPAEPS